MASGTPDYTMAASEWCQQNYRASFAASTTSYYNPRNSAYSSNEAIVAPRCLRSGVVRGFSALVYGRAGFAVGESYTITLRKNGVDTDHVITITSATPTNAWQASAGSPIAFNADDTFSLKVVSSAFAAARELGWLAVTEVVYK